MKAQHVGEVIERDEWRKKYGGDEVDADAAVVEFNCPAVGDTVLTLLLRLCDRVLLQSALDLCATAGRKCGGLNVRKQGTSDLANALGLGGLLVWGCAVTGAFQRLGRLKHLMLEADQDGKRSTSTLLTCGATRSCRIRYFDSQCA
jgi:hypothetical protein